MNKKAKALATGFYEEHGKAKDEFPFIFHLDKLKSPEYSSCHWHESVELLFIIKGECSVLSDITEYRVKPGDIVVINSGNLHCFANIIPEESRYYCLIVDKSFTDALGIAVDSLEFAPVVRDEALCGLMDEIIREINGGKPYFMQSVKGIATQILVRLSRDYSSQENNRSIHHNYSKSEIVKNGIEHISKQFREKITLDEIARQSGCSKYYFCRLFKDYTGKSVMDFLNRYRCEYARKLLKSGSYNISESAVLCGIPHLSHFSKLYRRHLGVSPSEDIKKTEMRS